jgi:membrane-associated HD superfamily phosphohydrolase
VEIAESNGLPKELREFITQHHGTNLVTFFYIKAKERGDDVDEEDSNFHYPGPRPQTKETGIVMLADAVEATTRTFRDPSVSRIRNIVNQIVADRFTSGQLDECPLTLRDLNQIKLSFERTITGIFHGRVRYPGEQKSDASKEKRGEPQPSAVGRDWEDDDVFGDEASAHA